MDPLGRIPPRWRWIGVGALAMLGLLVLGALLFIYSGAYDIAASRPHYGPVEWVLRTTAARSVAARADRAGEPPELSPDEVRHGLEHFGEMCAVCHGAPGVERDAIGQGLTPQAPRLSEVAGDWSRRELFWIIKNGIKMTGMPAFGETHPDPELWAMVEAVRRLPGLSPEEYARVAGAGETGESPPSGAEGAGEAADDHGHDHEH